MNTIREGLYDLLSSVEIDTKEQGRCHVEPWPSQRMLIDTVAKGLGEGVHTFVILKCRQVAATTTASVISLFWALANPGVQGAIIADRTDNLERLRRIFASLLETLPSEWRSPEHRLITNNRNGMAFANRSVIELLAAGSNPDLGASRALNMAHMTECSLWRSLAGVESLKASLASQNPNRLYIWESVANGLGNWYYSFCQQAKVDRHMRFLFLGFWSNPSYAIPKSDPDYNIYWDGSLSEDEITRARYVRQEYGVKITPQQIAWWRREAEFRPLEYMLRMYPWTDRECFIASGSGFFPAARTLEIAEALPTAPYKGYRYVFEEQFLSSRIEPVAEAEDAQLRVWENPQPDGVYVIGVDPSGGGGGQSNDHAIQVFRCYADRFIQVAEYQSNKPLTYQLAWVLAHLAGAYRDHVANLEVSGIGAAVLPEVRNLRQLAERGILQGENGEKILDMIGAVRWFLYKRPDTMGGLGNVIAWKTNSDNKQQIYSEVRDSLMLRRLEVRSVHLIKQIQAVVEDEGWIGAGEDTGEGDDLVSALVLAHHAYIEQRLRPLVARNLTWDSVHGARPPADMSTVLSFAFQEKMRAINRKHASRRETF